VDDLDPLIFDLDEAKRLDVIARRGVDMLYAARIFRGDVLTRVDDRRDYGETRHVSIGLVDGTCFVVVFTERFGIRRLITAWKGGRNERQAFAAYLAGRDRGDASAR
jgi:uncharacterized protein